MTHLISAQTLFINAPAAVLLTIANFTLTLMRRVDMQTSTQNVIIAIALAYGVDVLEMQSVYYCVFQILYLFCVNELICILDRLFYRHSRVCRCKITHISRRSDVTTAGCE